MQRSLRIVVSSLGALGLAVALAAVAMPSGMTSLTSRGSGHSSANSAQAERAALSVLTQSQVIAPGKPAPHTVGVQPAVTSAITNTGYYNWNGYADSTSTKNYFSSVSGSWVQEKVTCTSEDRQSSTWVGIDGLTNKTVEQDGTLSWCYRGTAYYYSWYEMYPAGTVVVAKAVKPGDHISASVTRSGTSYALKVTDSTTSGNNVSATKTCALATCADTSVEWINERPDYSTTGYTPLAVYTTWSLTGARAGGGGKSGVITTFPTTYKIEMIDATDTYALATAGTLNSSGNAFTTTWDDSY